MARKQKLLLLALVVTACFVQTTEALFTKKLFKKLLKLEDDAPAASDELDLFKLPKLFKPLKLFESIEDKKELFAAKIEKGFEKLEDKFKTLIDLKEEKKEKLLDKKIPAYAKALPLPAKYKPPLPALPPASCEEPDPYYPPPPPPLPLPPAPLPLPLPPAYPPPAYPPPLPLPLPAYPPPAYPPPAYLPLDCELPVYAPPLPLPPPPPLPLPPPLPAYPAECECGLAYSAEELYT